MVLLIDIGNTRTHLALANAQRLVRRLDIPTAAWLGRGGPAALRKCIGNQVLEGAALCSVVPRVTPRVKQAVKQLWKLACFELTANTLRGVGIDYPKSWTLGPDRLANVVAAHHRFGAPVIAIDFGTAVTLDVVDRKGNFVGGIIAPGLAAMTDYLHEKTALLPRIKIVKTRSPIGKSTKGAMLAGVVYGYPGLVRQLIIELKQALAVRQLPIVATGGDGQFIASKLPEITAVEPMLTLEGLRLVWQSHRGEVTLKP